MESFRQSQQVLPAPAASLGPCHFTAIQTAGLLQPQCCLGMVWKNMGLRFYLDMYRCSLPFPFFQEACLCGEFSLYTFGKPVCPSAQLLQGCTYVAVFIWASDFLVKHRQSDWCCCLGDISALGRGGLKLPANVCGQKHTRCVLLSATARLVQIALSNGESFLHPSAKKFASGVIRAAFPVLP